MPFFSKARTLDDDTTAHRQVTRFQRTHVRERPVADIAGTMDATGKLTRMETQHVRAAPSVTATATSPVSAPVSAIGFRTAPKVNRANPAADLHDAAPVPVSVLLRALPLRAAQVPAQTDA